MSLPKLLLYFFLAKRTMAFFSLLDPLSDNIMIINVEILVLRKLEVRLTFKNFRTLWETMAASLVFSAIWSSFTAWQLFLNRRLGILDLARLETRKLSYSLGFRVFTIFCSHSLPGLLSAAEIYASECHCLLSVA